MGMHFACLRRDIWVASTLFVQLKQPMDKTPYIIIHLKFPVDIVQRMSCRHDVMMVTGHYEFIYVTKVWFHSP